MSWLDVSGKMKMTRTRAVGISERGISIELPEAARLMSLVRFASDRFKFSGAGSVRYCRRAGAKYIVGLEFTEGLRWKPPEDDVIEPIPICDPGQ